MRSVVVLIVLTFSFCLNASQALLEKANQSYLNGDYDNSVEIYRSLLSEGGSAQVYYNLGNSYYRLQDLGRAIFYYKEAQYLTPRDADLNYNLAYARKEVKNQVSTSFFDGISIPMTPSEMLVLLLLIGVILFGSNSILLVRDIRWMRTVRNILIPIFMTVIVFTYLASSQNRDHGVVVAEKVNVYSSMGRDKVTLFSLSSGTEFFLNQRMGDGWRLIELSDGKKGWIKSEAIVERRNGI